MIFVSVLFNRFAHSAGPGLFGPWVEWMGSGVDLLMQNSKGEGRSRTRAVMGRSLTFCMNHWLTALGFASACGGVRGVSESMQSSELLGRVVVFSE